MSVESTAPITAELAAAEWWAERLGAPVFRSVDDRSGSDRIIGEISGMFMQVKASGSPMPAGSGEKFVAALAPKISEMLGQLSWVSLGVDYGPDLALAEAAEAAGISLSRFPWKTHMSVTRNYVTASLGYRAPDRLIWTSPGWERPACGTQRYDEADGWQPRDEVCSLVRFHDGDHGQWVADVKRCVDCGGTYTDHFGPNRVAGTHSWKPGVSA